MAAQSFGKLVPVVLIFALAPAPQPAKAWDTEGHRLICGQAWDELQPGAMREVRAALGVTSRGEFAARCVHTDIEPADLLELPAGAHGIDYERDCPERQSCPVREIDRALADLGARRGDLGEAILRLAHFTGEVHQPLSVGYAADRNGLDTEATFLGRKTNMHAIWNEGLVTAPRPARAADTGFDLREITNYLERSQWTQLPPPAWATESYWIMRTPATGYVGNPGNLTFDEVYVAQNKQTVLEQIEKAGIRLAHLLNRAFGDPGASLPITSPALP